MKKVKESLINIIYFCKVFCEWKRLGITDLENLFLKARKREIGREGHVDVKKWNRFIEHLLLFEKFLNSRMPR